MGDDDDGAVPFLGPSLEELDDDLGRLGIESGRRLVGEDELGFAGEGPGDCHALALSAREVLGLVMEPMT